MTNQRKLGLLCCLLLLAFGAFSTRACAQLDFEQPPISYSESQPTDRVAGLLKKVESGALHLEWDEQHGYLRSLLKALKISTSTQTLVFSKTSLQVGQISPARPRAIYFNDDVYVGWVQGGRELEISASDPFLGGTFYSLQQTPSEARVVRETSRCLQCHGSTHTRRIPGHIVRSLFTEGNGQPVFRLGTELTNDSTPFDHRWGGWYVTGIHGAARHRGNAWLDDREGTADSLPANGNVTELSGFFDVSPYLTAKSDIVALMVLQHQVHVHNVLTRAGHNGHRTFHDAVIMNHALDRSEDFQSDSTQRRYLSAAEQVVAAILFADEFQLTAPVQGSLEFQHHFAKQGPFDERGRSLRQFDLQTRLFRYPCSFLVYTDAFRSLPEGVMNKVEQRLRQILGGEPVTESERELYSPRQLTDREDKYEHLVPTVRQDILQILQATTSLRLGEQSRKAANNNTSN